VRRCFVLALAAVACAPTQAVRPLGRGNAVAQLSVGGPLVQVSGADIATPILSLGGGYGISDDLEATAELDATAAVFGVAHLAAGAAYHPVVRDEGAVPTLTVAPSIHLLTNVHDTRVAPAVAAAAAWRIHHRHLLYAGGDAGLVFGDPTRLVVGPFVGGQLRVGRSWGLGLEVKWLAPNYDVGPTAPSWLSPWNHGYLTVLIGLSRYIGDVR
jgi:hypothetical protein